MKEEMNMRDKKVLAVIVIMTLARSRTTISMIPNNQLTGFTSTTSKVDLGLQENVGLAADDIEGEILAEKRLVKPEIQFAMRMQIALQMQTSAGQRHRRLRKSGRWMLGSLDMMRAA